MGSAVSLLEITVVAGETGPAIVLSGETDATTAPALSSALTAQIADGAQHLTVDISALRFADSASVRALVLAARILKQGGGDLVLVHPQSAVARVLSLMGIDRVLTVQLAAGPETAPEAT
jgi:anti-anti-sigma factor